MSRRWFNATFLALAIQIADPPYALCAPANEKEPAPRSWLRQTTHEVAGAANAAQKQTVPWRGLLAVLVVGGLGLAAINARRKRRGPLAHHALTPRVLGSTRVGPKAQAMVIEVAGRVLLLGVTDGSVQKLAWLDKGNAAETSTKGGFSLFESEPPKETPRLLSNASAPAVAENGSSRFREVLAALLGRQAATPSAAEQIAAETEDVYAGPGGAAPAPGPAVEGQAAGLAARFAKAVR